MWSELRALREGQDLGTPPRGGEPVALAPREFDLLHALLLRAGRVIASGPVAEVVNAERLRELYGAPVDASGGQGGLPVFLPALVGAVASQ